MRHTPCPAPIGSFLLQMSNTILFAVYPLSGFNMSSWYLSIWLANLGLSKDLLQNGHLYFLIEAITVLLS